MNIFFLDNDINLSAQYHCDKHVVKMIIEYAQLLSTTHRIIDNITDDDLLYKTTHTKHPSAIWTMQSIENYNYLYSLFIALCNEYTHRYGKVHLSFTKLATRLKNPPINIPQTNFINPPLVMPSEYHCDDYIKAYRDYYKSKNFVLSYKNRQTPDWLSN